MHASRVLVFLSSAVLAVAGVAFSASAESLAGIPGASVSITSGGAINASTYNFGSFSITNTSSGSVRITRVRLDLTTALFPDLVFDPNGTAGDTVAKCFTADNGAGTTGLVAPADPCADPYGGPHDHGYDTLQIDFTTFSSGRTFSFSADVDPTSIQGAIAPGPGESGSISGLELTGATITITFDNGAVLTGQCFGDPGSDGSCSVNLASAPAAAPGLSFPGLAPPVTVVTPAQTARVTGPVGAQVALLQVEAALFTAGVPNGGFDLDPYEANSALVVSEQDVTIGLSGSADIPVTLTRSDPAGGLNYFVAVIRDSGGATGLTSPVVVIDYDDCSAPPPRSVTLGLDQGGVLSWTPLPGALSYDIVKGDPAILRSTGSWGASILACLGDNATGTTVTDSAAPAIGTAYYYLVRGVGCGGDATYDDGVGSGQAGPRDAAIDAAPAACP
jgi:hypothetical protein